MARVPEAYFEFVMHYAPWFYAVTTPMSEDPPVDQKNVSVVDGEKFGAGMHCQIKDSARSEWNEVDTVNGNVVTMKNNLQFTYYVAKDGTIEHGDNEFGKGAFPAAFGIEFLCEAYLAPQYTTIQTAIYSKIVDLADWLITQQCSDPAKKAYGGFKSGELSTQYWAIDAGRIIPALLKAYSLTSKSDYLDSAKLAGNTYLYAMQQQPSILGFHDECFDCC